MNSQLRRAAKIRTSFRFVGTRCISRFPASPRAHGIVMFRAAHGIRLLPFPCPRRSHPFAVPGLLLRFPAFVSLIRTGSLPLCGSLSRCGSPARFRFAPAFSLVCMLNPAPGAENSAASHGENPAGRAPFSDSFPFHPDTAINSIFFRRASTKKIAPR